MPVHVIDVPARRTNVLLRLSFPTETNLYFITEACDLHLTISAQTGAAFIFDVYRVQANPYAWLQISCKDWPPLWDPNLNVQVCYTSLSL